jgi:hypothetical protein
MTLLQRFLKVTLKLTALSHELITPERFKEAETPVDVRIATTEATRVAVKVKT